MMHCRGMGAVTKKGNKGPIERKMGGKMMPGYKKGKMVKPKMKAKGY